MKHWAIEFNPITSMIKFFGCAIVFTSVSTHSHPLAIVGLLLITVEIKLKSKRIE